MIEISCLHCHKTMRVLDSRIGSEMVCSNCGYIFIVPSEHSSLANEGVRYVSGSHLSARPSAVSGLSSVEPFQDARFSPRMMDETEHSIAEAIFRQRRAQKIALVCISAIIVVVALHTAVTGNRGNSASNVEFDSVPQDQVRFESQSHKGEGLINTLPEKTAASSTQVFSDTRLYHLSRVCLSLKVVPAISTLEIALSKGKQPCRVCAPNEPVNRTPLPPAPPEVKQGPVSASEKPTAVVEQKEVFVGQLGEKYHRKNCEKLYGLIKSMSLSSAQLKGLTACADCKPPR